MDSTTLVTLLSEGAVVASEDSFGGATELVRTDTTDAYQTCKKAVRALFGTDEEAKEKLAEFEVRPTDIQMSRTVLRYLEKHDVLADPGVRAAAGALQIALAGVSDAREMSAADSPLGSIEAEKHDVMAESSPRRWWWTLFDVLAWALLVYLLGLTPASFFYLLYETDDVGELVSRDTWISAVILSLILIASVGGGITALVGSIMWYLRQRKTFWWPLAGSVVFVIFMALAVEVASR